VSLDMSKYKIINRTVYRHLVGILTGTRPCGIVVLFEELYGSESLTQG
jgi:hypothetical protein